MVKKTIGIATILLLILVIGITISRASTRATQTNRYDLKGLALNQPDYVRVGDVQAKVLLSKLYVTPALGTLRNLDLSTALENRLLNVSYLPKSLHTDLALALHHHDNLEVLSLST